MVTPGRVPVALYGDGLRLRVDHAIPDPAHRQRLAEQARGLVGDGRGICEVTQAVGEAQQGGLPGLGLAAFGDVAEHHGDLARLGRPDAVGLHLEPAAERLGAVLELGRSAGQRHLAVCLRPKGFEVGRELAGKLSYGRRHAALLLEGAIGFEDAVVDAGSALKHHLDQQKPAVTPSNISR